MGPPQGFAAGHAQTQLPPGTDFPTRAIPVVGKALLARLAATSACLLASRAATAPQGPTVQLSMALIYFLAREIRDAIDVRKK